MRTIKSRSVEAELKKLAERQNVITSATERVVSKILKDVRSKKDRALRSYAQKFDGLGPKQDLRVSGQELKSALNSVSSDFRRALESAAANIRRFAEMQMPEGFMKELQPGISVGQVVRPIDSVGCYVPGGRYPLPSSLLMTVIPAQVAGVPNINVVSPKPAPETLAAAAILGIESFFRIGGAQAIAALAYGTETVPRVLKIVGPGNRFVTCAKKLVAFDCSIDMLAGPTEAIVVAEEGEPSYFASDLLAQAEHDPDTSVVFVTSNTKLAKGVEAELKRSAKSNPIAKQSLEKNGVIFIAASPEQSMEIANAFASEHITVPTGYVDKVQNAGSIFVGDYSPQSLGDYASGPNHVLPTGGVARFRAGLSVLDYVKIISVQEVSLKGLKKIGPTVTTLAEAEGLKAHADSVRVRLTNA